MQFGIAKQPGNIGTMKKKVDKQNTTILVNLWIIKSLQLTLGSDIKKNINFRFGGIPWGLDSNKSQQKSQNAKAMGETTATQGRIFWVFFPGHPSNNPSSLSIPQAWRTNAQAVHFWRCHLGQGLPSGKGFFADSAEEGIGNMKHHFLANSEESMIRGRPQDLTNPEKYCNLFLGSHEQVI